MSHYWPFFVELIRTPFRHGELIWGIVPLYFGLLLNEITPAKKSFRTAIQTGFSFLWAAAQWIWPYFVRRDPKDPHLGLDHMLPINLLVTAVVVTFGIIALFSGLRRRYPKYCGFLGYTRFANYFMIVIFPIQAHYLTWTAERLVAIGLFAVPIWLLLHFGLMPIRNWR